MVKETTVSYLVTVSNFVPFLSETFKHVSGINRLHEKVKFSWSLVTIGAMRLEAQSI